MTPLDGRDSKGMATYGNHSSSLTMLWFFAPWFVTVESVFPNFVFWNWLREYPIPFGVRFAQNIKRLVRERSSLTQPSYVPWTEVMFFKTCFLVKLAPTNMFSFETPPPTSSSGSGSWANPFLPCEPHPGPWRPVGGCKDEWGCWIPSSWVFFKLARSMAILLDTKI